MQELGLLKEAPGKRCHTILSKLQRNGFLVLKRYRDAKNKIFSSNSVKRCLFMEGKMRRWIKEIEVLLLFPISTWTWYENEEVAD